MAKSRKEKGQATLILVLALSLVLVGGMGLAIDGAHLYDEIQLAQVAADSSATAAAMSIFQGNYTHTPSQGTDFTVNASFTCTGSSDTRLPCQYAMKDGFGSDTTLDTVTIDYPTCTGSVANPAGSCGYATVLATGLAAGVPNQVRVTISRNAKNSIIRMLGMGGITVVNTTATAAIVQVQTPTPMIITDPYNANTLNVVGGGSSDNIKICGGPSQAIQVNSKNAAAYNPPSSGYIDLQYGGAADTSGNCTTGTGSSFGINGGPYATGGGTVNRVELGTTGQYFHHAPIADPYEFVSNPTAPSAPTGTNPLQVTASSSPNYGCTAPNSQGNFCYVYNPGLYGTCAGCAQAQAGVPGGNVHSNPGFDFTGIPNVIFQPGLYYVQGGGVTFKNDNGGTLPLLNPSSPNSSSNPYTGSQCSGAGCNSTTDTGTGMVIFNTGDGNHNGNAISVAANAYISFVGPTITQVVHGQTVPGPPYYGLTIWNDNQSTNFVTHNLGAGNGCFQVTGTTYITPTSAIMASHSTSTSYQVAYYHGTPCSSTVTKGDIVVSDLQLDGTSGVTMNLVPYGFLYTYQVALVSGGAHPN